LEDVEMTDEEEERAKHDEAIRQLKNIQEQQQFMMQ
jgi:hypothetical protein